jgi:hypothetical protein
MVVWAEGNSGGQGAAICGGARGKVMVPQRCPVIIPEARVQFRGDMGNDKKYRGRAYYSTGGTIGFPGFGSEAGRGGDGVALVVRVGIGGLLGCGFGCHLGIAFHQRALSRTLIDRAVRGSAKA